MRHSRCRNRRFSSRYVKQVGIAGISCNSGSAGSFMKVPYADAAPKQGPPLLKDRDVSISTIVALFDGVQELRDIGHGRDFPSSFQAVNFWLDDKQAGTR